MKTKFILALCLAGSMGYAQTIIYTAAGTGVAGNSGNGGFAQSAKFGDPFGVVVDGSGNMYISDYSSHTVRKVNTNGIISAYAGTGTSGYSGDGGAATSAKLNMPAQIAIDGSGNLYIADQGNNVIRKVSSSGTITTFAGNGTQGYSGDNGPATSANLSNPLGVAVDASGIVYIADEGNNVIRKVASGTITTFAGNGTAGYSGDGGTATAAKLWGPYSVSVDANGVYIADNGNYRIRKVASGIITTVAGNGTAGSSGDGGSATTANINIVSGGVYVNGTGDIYIADDGNSKVRKVSSGTINTFAGTSTGGYSGDGGSPTSAQLGSPIAIATDGSGNVYIADASDVVVRKISANCPALAGPNVHDQNTNCCPPPCTTGGVSIGSPSVPSMNYSWSPNSASYISGSHTIAQPTAVSCNTSTPTTYTVTVSATGCTTSTSTVTVTTNPAGTNCCRKIRPSDGGPSTLPSNFAAFPNPAKEQVTIDLYYQADYIKIVDVAGRVMFESKDVPMGELKINLSKYTKGMYIVESRIDNVIEKQKLIVE